MPDVKQFSSDKILKHLDRVTAWLRGKNPPPITMELDLTNVCNHRCPDCVVGYFRTRDRNQLTGKLAARIIRELGRFGVRGLIFTGGGEPLCHPAAPKLAALARRCGMDVGFITNGELLTESSATALLKNCVWIRVSLDAATPKLFHQIHGGTPASFARVLENLRLLVSLKRKTRSRCTLGVGFLTTRDSRREMLPATKLARELGVDYIQFRPMQIRTGAGFDYHWENVDAAIARCRKLARPGFDVLFSQHKYEMMKTKNYGRDYGKCHGHQFASTIGADGRVYLCCHLRHYQKYCLGDLHRQTFKQVWNSTRRQRVCRTIDFRDCIPLCRDNTFNQVLWNISQSREHVNFL